MEPLEITLRNQIILNKKSTQLLGMTLDSRLNWEKHIDTVKTKAKKTLNTIKMVADKNWGGDCRTLKRLSVQCSMYCTLQPPQGD